MTHTQQVNTGTPVPQQTQQRDQLMLFFKSYIKSIKKNIDNSNSKQYSQNTIFDLKKASVNVSLESFLKRIFTYFKCGIQAYICSLCFIDRFLQSQSAITENIKLTMKNVFKIISVSLLLSTKNFDDFYYANTYYARVCGLTLSQINQLEKQFLKIIDFNVFIDSQQYKIYERMVNNYKHIIQNQGRFMKQQSHQLNFKNRNQIKKQQNVQAITDQQAARESQEYKAEVQANA